MASHTVVVPGTYVLNGDTYDFVRWEDNSTNLTRVINLTSDLTITAIYQKRDIEPTPIIRTFSGNVSAQRIAGEDVTITVTKPDATEVSFTAKTQPDGSYTIKYTFYLPGAYSAQSSVPSDGVYVSKKSPVKPFDCS